MTDAQAALDFVKEHGVVLVSAKGDAPKLTDAIVGAPVKGSWWSHPEAHRIFATLQEVTASKDVLTCRMVDGKVTLVHRRLWPALVRLAKHFDPGQIAQVQEVHTASGKHETRTVEFPLWVPPDVAEQAKKMKSSEAVAALGRYAKGVGRAHLR